jgi:hypothetical protein
MERVHELVAAGTLEAEDNAFWIDYWQNIASAKVSLEAKVAAYHALKLRGVAEINGLHTMEIYKMLRADRTFVAELELDRDTAYRYRLCLIWLDDDVATLARIDKDGIKTDRETEHAYGLRLNGCLRRVLMQINAPRCMRFLIQDKIFRETVMQERMTPLVQRLAEELVQPMDQLGREWLLFQGQSVKLIGMCVKDKELVATWLQVSKKYIPICWGRMSISLARKLHTLATPDQCEAIKTTVLDAIDNAQSGDGLFELAWLFGLMKTWLSPVVRMRLLRSNVSSFPAFTFAMIVAMCDGYLKVTREITPTQKRFFDLVIRLPMDLQALVSLRLWGHTSAVIPSEKFDRAFLSIV